MIEAIVLSIVAVATAWSGYQAARWDAVSSLQYSLATRMTVLAQEQMTIAGQDRLYDIVTFDNWIAQKTAGHEELAAIFERRFRPEYRVAFNAWQKLHPLTNPSAPAGPNFMKQYVNANEHESARLENEAIAHFDRAVSMRDIGDRYVRVTVFLATVLFLTALSGRFEALPPRVAVVGVASLLLITSTYWIVSLPRA